MISNYFMDFQISFQSLEDIICQNDCCLNRSKVKKELLTVFNCY